MRVFAVACVAISGLALGVDSTLKHLERPFVKRYVRDAARTYGGVELDYDALAISLWDGTLHAKGVALRQPRRFRRVAPYWLRVARLDLAIEVASLRSPRIVIHRVAALEVELDIVSDETTDTITLEFPTTPEDDVDPTLPLSATLRRVSELGVDVVEAHLTLRRARWFGLQGSEVAQRAAVHDVSARAHLRGGVSPLDVQLELRAATPSANASDGSSTRVRVDFDTFHLSHANHPPAAQATGASVPEPDPEVHATAQLELSADATITDQLRVRLDARANPFSGVGVSVRGPVDVQLRASAQFDEHGRTTRLTVEQLALLGGALTGHFAATVADDAFSSLEHVAGVLDLSFATLPVRIDGIEAEGARAHLELTDATLSPQGVTGEVTFDATLTHGALRRGSISASADTIRMSVHTSASPDAAGGAGARGTVAGSAGFALPTLDVYAVELDATRFDFADFTPTPSTARNGPDAVVDVVASADGVFSTLPTWSAAGTALEFRATGGLLALDAADATPSRGSLDDPDAVSISLARLSVVAGPSTSATLEAARAHVTGKALVASILRDSPLTLHADIEARRLVANQARESINLAPVQLSTDLDTLNLHGSGMFGLNGRATLGLETSGAFAASGIRGNARGLSPHVRIDFDRGSIDGEIALDAVEVVDAGRRATSFRGTALTFTTNDAMSLTPPTSRGSLHVEGRIARVQAANTSLDVPSIELDVRAARGVYSATGQVQLAELIGDGVAFPGTHGIQLEASADLMRHVYGVEAHLTQRPDESNAQAATDAPSPPTLDLSVQASADRTSGALHHAMHIAGANLMPFIAPFLPRDTDVSFSRLELEASGDLTGILDPHLSPMRPVRLSPNAIDRAMGATSLRARLFDLHYAEPTREFNASSVELDGSWTRNAEDMRLLVDAEIPDLRATLGHDELAIARTSVTLRATLPEATRNSPALASIHATTGAVTQEIIPGYPVGQLTLDADVEAGASSARIRRFRLENTAGRTVVELSGTYEGALHGIVSRQGSAADATLTGREAVAVSGTVTQDVSAFAASSLAQRAEGRLELPFRVESGDLQTFQVRASVIAHDVIVSTPDSTMALDAFNCEVPLYEVVTRLPTGMSVDVAAGGNLLGRARFPDVQPFLQHDAFVSAARVIIGEQTFAPVVGNLRVNGTTLALDRAQAGYRSGTLTGSIELDFRPGASAVVLRGNATGVRSREGDDVLDANLALRFIPESLSLDGTITFVQLGKAHLIEAMNLVDPYHENVDINTVRSLLRFGYPRFLRARASEGLMNLDLALGGIASIASVQTIQAIPIAPLLDQYVSPIVDPIFRRAEHLTTQDHAPTPIPTPQESHDE